MAIKIQYDGLKTGFELGDVVAIIYKKDSITTAEKVKNNYTVVKIEEHKITDKNGTDGYTVATLEIV
jgi:hypothetical protein